MSPQIQKIEFELLNIQYTYKFLGCFRVGVDPHINSQVVVSHHHILDLQGAVSLWSFTHHVGPSSELGFHLIKSLIVYHRIIHVVVLVPNDTYMLRMARHHSTASFDCSNCCRHMDGPTSDLVENWHGRWIQFRFLCSDVQYMLFVK